MHPLFHAFMLFVCSDFFPLMMIFSLFWSFSRAEQIPQTTFKKTNIIHDEPIGKTLFSRLYNDLKVNFTGLRFADVYPRSLKYLHSFFFKIWDTTSTGKGEESLNGGDTKAMEISALEFSHDGTKLAVIVNNCDYVHVLETESGKIISTIEVCNTTISDTSLILVTYNMFGENYTVLNIMITLLSCEIFATSLFRNFVVGIFRKS